MFSLKWHLNHLSAPTDSRENEILQFHVEIRSKLRAEREECMKINPSFEALFIKVGETELSSLSSSYHHHHHHHRRRHHHHHHHRRGGSGDDDDDGDYMIVWFFLYTL